MNMFLKRIKEPSTWAGITGLAVIFGMPESAANSLVQIAAGVTGLLAVVLPEVKKGE